VTSIERTAYPRFKRLITHLDWVDALGDTGMWMDGVAARKVTDFAGKRTRRMPPNSRRTCPSSGSR